jgi:SAM-dependent methyltransferase
MPPAVERRCVHCGNAVDVWLPFDDPRFPGVPEFHKRLETIGSNVERFWCPSCHTHDRERHLRLYFQRFGVLEAIRGGNVLHIAPEGSMPPVFESYAPARYVMGDPNPVYRAVQMVLEALPFADATFDLVLANHVLEHVLDYRASVREVARVLKPGGRFICQTPYTPRLSHTLEDPLLDTVADREFFYGQADHLRLFGADLPDIIREGGFRGRLVSHDEALPGVDPEAAGVNEREPFFDFVRI